MITLVTDNTANTEILGIEFRKTALTSEENQRLIEDTPEEELVLVDEQYRAYKQEQAELEGEQRPKLTKHVNGPFILGITNFGAQAENSTLLFEIRKAQNAQREIINEIDVSPIQITRHAIAIFPFVTLFKDEINTAANKLLRFSKRQQQSVVNLDEAWLNRQKQLARNVVNNMLHQSLHAEQERKQKNDDDSEEEILENLSGMDAIQSSLAFSLAAGEAFYTALWNNMMRVYEPAIDDMAERVALNQTSLKTDRQLII